MKQRPPSSVTRAIIVCALGYFIDVYDIMLFTILRVPSLTELKVPADRLAAVGGSILSAQMLGTFLGGFLWGWLGDRFGRLKALYGSILIYSIGTLCCSFVQDPATYGIMRFITAFGLAGEIGAAVVLISELMPAAKRGWGITIIGGIGFLGPVVAILTSLFLGWRETYIFAGIIGLLLLGLRLRLSEPVLFEKMKHKESTRDLFRYFTKPRTLKPFFLCLLMALPLCYAWNLLNFFSMELSHEVLAPDAVFNQKTCMILFFTGTSIGDVLSGTLTQIWRRRRKAMTATLLVGAVATMLLLLLGPSMKFSTQTLYGIYFILGLASGCWALATMITAEQFGTNIRSTASLLMFNFLRGFTIPMVMLFQGLKGSLGMTNAAAMIGLILYAMAFMALGRLKETHGHDLDYVETRK